MDWKALEQHLVDSAKHALQALLAQEQGPVYAAAFHASYREEEQVLSLPSFAANTLSALETADPEGEEALDEHCGGYDATAADIAEAMRGRYSPHAGIRQHAATVLEHSA